MTAALTCAELQRFCAPDSDEREHLRQPWAHLGHTYATNGHIIVRVLGADPAVTSQHKLAASAVKLFDEAKKSEYIALPKFDKPLRCQTCRGKARTMQAKCPDCKDGEFLHGNFKYTCQNCEETGWILSSEDDPRAILRSCEHCDGRGHHRGEFCLVGNSYFDAVYLLWVSKMPGLRGISTNGDKPAHFTFDGGDGLLMPRRSE